MKTILVLVCALDLMSSAQAAEAAAVKRPNILFIAVDDLRPELGCYGQSHIQSPHIDRLAAEGLVFTRAYCQIASCCPSRSSVLTGLRPDSTGVIFDNSTHFRQKVPDVVTLPQQFKLHWGYHTQALGKVFHGGFEEAYGGRKLDDPPSWSAPTTVGSPRAYFTPQNIETARKIFARKSGKRGAALDAWTEASIRIGPTEAPDVADSELYDGKMAGSAIEVLREIQGQDKPFFLGVGFLKPHLPFVAPKKYWDLYDPAKIQLAPNDFYPRDAPPAAPHDSEEVRHYTGMPKTGPLTEAQARHLRHAYYACVSFTDAQIGRLLDELDRLGLRDNTIVVLWGDHGWHLGEQLMWGKNTTYENATRVPLIVSVPGAKAGGQKSAALVELVDLYPSLCELVGLPLPAHLEGTSFVPLLDKPEQAWKSAAFSQHPRPGLMGYTLRTDRHRLTLWQAVDDASKVEAVELYDHRSDAAENTNVAGLPENGPLVKELTDKLHAGWRAARPGP
ncbi:MAG: sulfatase [Prosthecobacter sp.]